MITETGRLILSYLLGQDNNSISSRRLAEYCNLSLSTIRSEINWLNDELAPYGIHVDARQAQGCKLIFNPDKENEKAFEQLKYDLRRKLFNFSSKSYRSDYILRRLLISSDYVSADKFSEELFFSSSTVLRSISQAQNTIKRYGLEIKLKKNHGLYIDGDEFAKRVYMLTQHKKFVHLDTSKQAQEQKFSDYFLTDSAYYHELKNKIIHLLLNYPELEFSYINVPKLINYLILCKHRHNSTDKITFTQEQLDYIHAEKAYAFSIEVFDQVKDFMEFTPSEKDICSFAQIVLGCRTLSSYSQISLERKESIVPLSVTILNELFQLDNMDREMLTPDIIEQFTLCMETIHCRMLMKIPFDMEILYPVKGSSMITADLCCTLIKLIEKHLHYVVEDTYIRSFTFLFERMLEDYNKSAIQLKLLIISLYGKDHAQSIASYLNRHFSHTIQTIDTAEYTSLNAVDLNQYDYVFTNLSGALFDNLEHVIISDFLQLDSLSAQYEEILNTIDKKKYQKLLQNRIFHTKFRKQEEVFNYIANLYEKQVSDKEAFKQDLIIRNDRISSLRRHNLAFLGTYNDLLPESTLAIFINDKELDWTYDKAQYFVFYHYKRDHIEDALTINTMLKQLLHSSAVDFEEFIK